MVVLGQGTKYLRGFHIWVNNIQLSSTGTNATTCTPGANQIRRMLKACDHLPVNTGITGKGNESSYRPLQEQCLAGVVGLKLHEDWGSSPSAIDTCLR